MLIRLDDDELVQLKSKIQLSGLSQESFIRKILNNYQIKAAPPVEYQTVISQLCNIGKNINQIAASANSLGIIDAEKYQSNYKLLVSEILKLQRCIEEPEMTRNI